MACNSSDNNPASQLQAQVQQQQGLTDQAVQGIQSAFSGFNAPFYQGAQNAYTNWAAPQVQQQFQQAGQQLGFKLGGQGLLNSSAANQGQNALSSAMTTAQNQVGNQAVATSQALQSQVGQEEANLIGQAQTASNPGALANSAQAQAASTQVPSTFAPIGNMFTSFGNQYLQGQQSNAYNNMFNQYLNGFSNPGVFGSQQTLGGSNLPSNIYN